MTAHLFWYDKSRENPLGEWVHEEFNAYSLYNVPLHAYVFHDNKWQQRCGSYRYSLMLSLDPESVPPEIRAWILLLK